MSINVIGCPQRREAGFFCSTCYLELLLARSSLSQLVLACSGMFFFFTRDDVTDCLDLQINFKSTSYKFYSIVGQALLDSGAALMYYKEGQVLQQSVAAFRYYKIEQVLLQRRESITKWDNFYDKVRQLLKSKIVQQINKSNGERQQILATDSSIYPLFACRQTITLRNF